MSEDMETSAVGSVKRTAGESSKRGKRLKSHDVEPMSVEDNRDGSTATVKGTVHAFADPLALATSVAAQKREAEQSLQANAPVYSGVNEDGIAEGGDQKQAQGLFQPTVALVTSGSAGRARKKPMKDTALSRVNAAGFYEFDEVAPTPYPEGDGGKGDELYYAHYELKNGPDPTHANHQFKDVHGKVLTLGPNNPAFTSHGGKYLPFGSAGVFYQLDEIQKGPSNSQRTGDAVMVRALCVRGNMRSNGLGTHTHPQAVRLILVYDHDPNGVTPSASDLLADYQWENVHISGDHHADGRRYMYGGGPHPLSFLQRKGKRFSVIKDALKFCAIDVNSSAAAKFDGHPHDASMTFNFDCRFPEGIPLDYIPNSSGGLIDNKVRGAFYLFAIGNEMLFNQNTVSDGLLRQTSSNDLSDAAGFGLSELSVELLYTQ